MGLCFSHSSDGGTRHHKPTANVVSLGGDLRRYPIPISVSEVLHYESPSNPVFLCDSDKLYFGELIPRLEPKEELEPAQIYFVLPVSKLDYRLAASDMAALAVKASKALNESNPHRKRRATRISPVGAEDPQSGQRVSIGSYGRNRTKVSELGGSRSVSMRKLQRYTSRRAKKAARSFRMRLSTINEGSVLVN